MNRIAQRRTRRLQDELDDAEVRLARWRFAMYPSQERKANERIAKLKERLAKRAGPVTKEWLK